jgi:hypothetical protein
MKAHFTTLFLCLLPHIAFASPTELTLFGHRVQILSKVQYGPEVLTVDEKHLVTEQYVSLKEIGLLGETAFAIGTTSPGGNACEGSLFVLSFIAGAPTRVDGPLDTCDLLRYRVEHDRIVVESQPSPSGDGSRWIWTANGFGAAEIVRFAPTTGAGWNALRSRLVQHPSELLQHSEFSSLLGKLLGHSRYSSLPRILTGPGNVQYESNTLIAEACQAHSCNDTSALIAIEIASQRVAIALKDGSNARFVVPRDDEWPDVAKPYLRRWRAKWRN